MTYPDEVLVGEVQELVELDTAVRVLLRGAGRLLGRSLLGVGEVSLYRLVLHRDTYCL